VAAVSVAGVSALEHATTASVSRNTLRIDALEVDDRLRVSHPRAPGGPCASMMQMSATHRQRSLDDSNAVTTSDRALQLFPPNRFTPWVLDVVPNQAAWVVAKAVFGDLCASAVNGRCRRRCLHGLCRQWDGARSQPDPLGAARISDWPRG
jgi:hypothetical protein